MVVAGQPAPTHDAAAGHQHDGNRFRGDGQCWAEHYELLGPLLRVRQHEDEMDLWDVIKIMGRRWYVALPMLLIAAVGGAYTVAKTDPDYVATTSMILLPPVQRADAPTRSATVNPWDQYSLTIAT